MDAPRSGTPSPRKGVILLVDDEADLRIVASKRLQYIGYQVVTADNGTEALRIARERSPDLILLDIMMPGMNGCDVCVKLKADPQTAHIPVIFLSALGMAQHVKQGLALGADDYIVKPFEAEALYERIAVCLERHRHDHA